MAEYINIIFAFILAFAKKGSREAERVGRKKEEGSLAPGG